MAIAIQKTKGKLATKAAVKQQTALEKLVDEFGALAEERKILEELPAFKNYDAKKTALLEELDKEFDAQEKGEVEGESFGTSFTAKRASNKVNSKENKQKIRELLGEEVFMACIDFSITKLKTYITGPQFAELVDTEYSGARTVKPYKK
jgi:hypothetical protein